MTNIPIKAEDIEIGTFLTKYDGLPTMGLMIQTIEPVDLRQQILSNQKIVERLKAEIESIDKMQHVDPREYNQHCIECSYKQQLQSILQVGEK